MALQLGHRQQVLALARPVVVGQQLSARDLKEVSVPADTGLQILPASSKARVEGRPAAYSLPAGTLLTDALLGTARVPQTGQAEAAVGLKAGQFPPGLQPGNRVTVVVAPPADATSGTAPSPLSWTGVVTGVRKDTTEQTTVVSIQMAQADAQALAAQPAGQISVVIVPEQRGGGR
ncbi:SAF domain-containing protein [Streptomyces sp. NRRL F-5123]|uniref:SAF domain-containing protein n=1 Tax=Streptomyces sp. NRRL F-5123 TaxID=1463856 RepID=UPI000693B705|nr:SAF domain-containing protein [Streptomyces sp. NRRL F-5123]